MIMTNNDDPSSWMGLPADLQALLSNLHKDVIAYPNREIQWSKAQEYLKNGDFRMASHVLQEMLSNQNNLQRGCEPELQQLLQAVETNKVYYPNREWQWSKAQEYLKNGDFRMATHVLQEMLSNQNNLQRGCEPKLQQLLQAVETDKVYYPNREWQWSKAQEYLKNGDYRMTTHVLLEMLEHQKNLIGK